RFGLGLFGISCLGEQNLSLDHLVQHARFEPGCLFRRDGSARGRRIGLELRERLIQLTAIVLDAFAFGYDGVMSLFGGFVARLGSSGWRFRVGRRKRLYRERSPRTKQDQD